MQVAQGGYFLKSMLKIIGFTWDKDGNFWKKPITPENTEATIRADLQEICDEWGFTLV